MKTYWQVVEKEDFGTDWHQVRYNAYALKRFDDYNEALDAASNYLTEVNCDNALAKAEKRQGFEAFMAIPDKGYFLGVLDRKDWYLDCQKCKATLELMDENGKRCTCKCIDKKSDKNDPTYIIHKPYFELAGKIEVAVRQLPGT